MSVMVATSQFSKTTQKPPIKTQKKGARRPFFIKCTFESPLRGYYPALNPPPAIVR